MVAALEAYFAAGHELPFPKAVFDEENDDLAAPITADLSAIQRDHGFNVREIGATYVTIVHGALVNMVPTLFWCIAYVFSRPLLVTRLRDELLAAVVIKNTNDEQQYALVDTDSIEGRCPLLLSVFRETQRLVAVGTLHRRVVEDTVVSDDCSGGGETGQKRSYLLKKGTSILIPVANNHRSQLIWGATGNEFYADRFLGLYPGNGNKNHPFNATAEKVVSKEMLDESASARSRKMAYFPFGGGKELCPGRNFATTQVLGTMSVLILGYHIEAANGGPLKQPSFSPSKMTAATARPHPDADLRGRVKRREGWEQVVWGVKPV